MVKRKYVVKQVDFFLKKTKDIPPMVIILPNDVDGDDRR